MDEGRKGKKRETGKFEDNVVFCEDPQHHSSLSHLISEYLLSDLCMQVQGDVYIIRHMDFPSLMGKYKKEYISF